MSLRSCPFTLLWTILNLAALQAMAGVEGRWMTFDDETDEPKSVIEIYKVDDGTLEGRVVEILKSERGPNPLCEKCPGERKDKPVRGMVILWDMEPGDESGEWSGGRILDPQNGKIYKSKMELREEGKLEVRGYIGFSLLGRSQIWERIED